MKTVFNAKKVLALLILALATADVVLPVSAMEVTNGDVLGKVNGEYGANLESVVGARIDTDLTKATITNTQTNSVLNWNNLNTAPDQKLIYNMTDGQVSLNNVIGTSISKFAGGIVAEHGRVIISNPNGMIFENGSYVNANALTVTTHNATLDENGTLRLYSQGNNASILFEGGSRVATDKVRFNIAKDLSIVSSNIDVNNANIVAGDTKLITADGVTFYAVNNNNPNYALRTIGTNGNANIGNVSVNNTHFAVKDTNTGKISIIAKGNVNVNKTNVNGKVDVDATIAKGGNVTLDKITSNDTVKVTGNKVAMYNSTVDNVDLDSKSDIKMQNVTATSDGFLSNIFAKNKAEVKSSKFHSIKAAAADITFTDTNLDNGSNVQATNNVTFNRSNKNNVISINNSTVVAGKDVNAHNTNISNSLVVANQNVQANNSTISNTEMKAERNVYAGDSKISDSTLTVNNDILVAGSDVSNSTLKATKDLKLGNAKLNKVKATGRYGFLNDATLENGTNVTVDTVTGNAYNSNDTVQNLVIKNSELQSNKNNINLKNTTIENGTLVTADGKDVNIDTSSSVSLVGAKIGGNLNVENVKNLVVANSKEGGNQYIPDMTNKEAITDYDKTKFDNGYFENIINNYGKDYGNNTNLSVIKGNVNITNSKNSLIINSIVGGNVTANNVYGESNIITSMIVGDYNPTKIATAYTNVYKSFIGGNYTKKFENQVVDTPTILPDLSQDRPVVIDTPTVLPDLSENRPVVVDKPTTLPDVSERNPVVVTPATPERTNGNSEATQNNNDRVASGYDDVNKRKFGNDVNTKFQRRFSPRGFAAQEDELNEMKNSTKSSIVKTENKNVKFTKGFYAY